MDGMAETRTVTATYVGPQAGYPMRGTVTFRMSRFILDPDNDGTWIGPGPLVTHLDEDGALSVDLIASDDATVAWQVREDFPGGRKFWVQVPLSTPDPVLLSDLTVVSGDPSTTFVPGPQGPPGVVEAVWTGQDARPLTGTHRWYANSTLDIESVRVSLGNAPTLGDVVVDVNVASDTSPPASIFGPANRPTVAVGEHDSGLVVPDVTTRMFAGEWLTVDIDDAVDGSGITVQVRLH